MSMLHDGRPVIIAAGSFSETGYNTAEIMDFTKEGATWQESNDILTLSSFFVSSLEWLMSVSGFHNQLLVSFYFFGKRLHVIV